MEFASDRTYKSKLLDMVVLHKTQSKCEQLKNELESLIIERSECLTKRKTLMERLISMQGDIRKARIQEFNWQRKMEEVTNSFTEYNNDYLQKIFPILGYQIAECKLSDNGGLQLTLQYRDECYVTYRETAQIFDLMEIFPPHPNFPTMQVFLQKSQDLRGLLACLRKYFDFALEYHEKPETI